MSFEVPDFDPVSRHLVINSLKYHEMASGLLVNIEHRLQLLVIYYFCVAVFILPGR